MSEIRSDSRGREFVSIVLISTLLFYSLAPLLLCAVVVSSFPFCSFAPPSSDLVLLSSRHLLPPYLPTSYLVSLTWSLPIHLYIPLYIPFYIPFLRYVCSFVRSLVPTPAILVRSFARSYSCDTRSFVLCPLSFVLFF